MDNIRKLVNKDCTTADTPFSSKIKSLTHDQPVHWHSYFEIEYIVEGDGEYILNGVSYKIQKNRMFFSTPSDFQEIHFSTQTKIINVQFSSELVNPDLYKVLSAPMIIEDTNMFYQQLMQSLCTYGPNGSHYNVDFIKNMLNSILFLIYSSKNSITVKNHNEVNNYFHRILLYINEHFQEELSLTDLSKQLHLRPEYISRLFKKNSSQTFSEYLTETRLSHAYKLLKITRLPVFDIATQSGYTSFPHFIRMFKRKYGYPPSQVRKKIE